MTLHLWFSAGCSCGFIPRPLAALSNLGICSDFPRGNLRDTGPSWIMLGRFNKHRNHWMFEMRKMKMSTFSDSPHFLQLQTPTSLMMKTRYEWGNLRSGFTAPQHTAPSTHRKLFSPLWFPVSVTYPETAMRLQASCRASWTESGFSSWMFPLMWLPGA